MQLFMDLELATLIFLVLFELFDGDNFTCGLQSAHEHFGEGALATLDLLRELVLLLKTTI